VNNSSVIVKIPSNNNVAFFLIFTPLSSQAFLKVLANQFYDTVRFVAGGPQMDFSFSSKTTVNTNAIPFFTCNLSFSWCFGCILSLYYLFVIYNLSINVVFYHFVIRQIV